MYATVIDGMVSYHPDVPSYTTMRDTVGGLIDIALNVASAHRDGISASVYVNDEGLLMSLPIRYIRVTDGSPLAGNLVIAGVDEIGETVALTELEIQDVFDYLMELDTPVTEYEL